MTIRPCLQRGVEVSDGTTPKPPPKTPSSPCILVVDDEDYVADLVALMLEQEGYEVAVAYNGHEALSQIAARRFSLIVTDIMMPHGEELFATIRELDTTRHLPMIMLSAKQKPRDLAPNVEFISKPFDIEALLHAIRERVGYSDGSPYEQ
jgi:CheY-like chemotaxis protein